MLLIMTALGRQTFTPMATWVVELWQEVVPARRVRTGWAMERQMASSSRCCMRLPMVTRKTS